MHIYVIVKWWNHLASWPSSFFMILIGMQNLLLVIQYNFMIIALVVTNITLITILGHYSFFISLFFLFITINSVATPYLYMMFWWWWFDFLNTHRQLNIYLLYLSFINFCRSTRNVSYLDGKRSALTPGPYLPCEIQCQAEKKTYSQYELAPFAVYKAS